MEQTTETENIARIIIERNPDTQKLAIMGYVCMWYTRQIVFMGGKYTKDYINSYGDKCEAWVFPYDKNTDYANKLDTWLSNIQPDESIDWLNAKLDDLFYHSYIATEQLTSTNPHSTNPPSANPHSTNPHSTNPHSAEPPSAEPPSAEQLTTNAKIERLEANIKSIKDTLISMEDKVDDIQHSLSAIEHKLSIKRAR